MLPDHQKINPDYAQKPDDDNDVFETEDEMIRYFINNPGLSQSFYWNKYENNPNNLMIGNHITTDEKFIISLTLDGTLNTITQYFENLKTFLHSEIGVISYINPAEYSNGEDFVNRYKV